jgi:hypothetical protein
MADVAKKPELLPILPAERIVLTEAQKQKPVWELLDEVLGPVPPEQWNKIPHDGAENHDHYLYGAPKKCGL